MYANLIGVVLNKTSSKICELSRRHDITLRVGAVKYPTLTKLADLQPNKKMLIFLTNVCAVEGGGGEERAVIC